MKICIKLPLPSLIFLKYHCIRYLKLSRVLLKVLNNASLTILYLSILRKEQLSVENCHKHENFFKRYDALL